MYSRDELISQLDNDISPVDELGICLVLHCFHAENREQRIREIITELSDDAKDAEELSSAFFACLKISGDPAILRSKYASDPYTILELIDITLEAVLLYVSAEACIKRVIEIHDDVFERIFSRDSVGYQIFHLYMLKVFAMIGYEEYIGRYKEFMNREVIDRCISQNPFFFYECFSSLGDNAFYAEAIEWNQTALNILQKYYEGDEKRYELVPLYNIARRFSIIGRFDLEDEYLNRVLSYEDRCIDECPDILSMAYSLKAENLPNIKSDHNDEVFNLLQRAHNLIEHIRDESSYNMAYLVLCKVGSKYFLDSGDYKRSELFSNDIYTAFMNGYGTYIDYLTSLNNLALSYMYQNMQSKAYDKLAEAEKYIKDNELEETEIAKIIKNTRSGMSGDDKQSVLDDAYETIMNCNTITSLNFHPVAKAVRTVILSGDKKKIDVFRIKAIILLMEQFANNTEDTNIRNLFLVTKALYSAYVRDNIETLNSIRKALYVEYKSDYENNLLMLYIGMAPALFEKVLSSEEYRDILLRLVHSFPRRIWKTLKLTDEMAILKELNFLSEGYKFVLSEYYRGKIQLSDAEVIEIALNCKNVYPDLLKLRKKIEQSNPWYKEDYDEINVLHRNVIDKELDRFFDHVYDRDEIKRLTDERHEKELVLLEDECEENLSWKPFPEITSSLPEGVLYIDYLVIPAIVGNDVYLKDEVYLRFALYKKNGIVYIKMLPFTGILGIRAKFEASERLIREKYGKGIIFDIGRKLHGDNLVLMSLYKELFIDAVRFAKSFGNFRTILMSGDIELCSFPYDALITEDGRYVAEKYEVINVNSLRDYGGDVILSEEDTKDAVVMGNPSFSVDIGLMSSGTNNDKYLVQIPLSKVEVQAVADSLGVKPLLRNDSNKSVLLRNPCRILHIAAHGIHLDVDYENEMAEFGIYGDVTNPMFTSCIFLSGANDWIIKNEIDNRYGNGVITAEELCTYDLNSLKMVVLSACFSGSGDINYALGLLGMRTALMATGARAIVTNLWEVDDFASAVFMTRFYNNLKSMKVSGALRDAKLYLKDITLAELTSDGWFGESRIRRLGLVADDMKKIASQPPATKIFEKPFYWAGFVLLEQ